MNGNPTNSKRNMKTGGWCFSWYASILIRTDSCYSHLTVVILRREK